MCTVIPKQKLQSVHDYRPELNLVVFYGSNPLQALLRSSTLHRLTESEWAFPFEEYPEKAFTSHLQLLPSRFAKRALSCWLIFRAGKFTSKGSDNPFTDFDLEREALLKTNMNYCSVLACWREWFGNGILKILNAPCKVSLMKSMSTQHILCHCNQITIDK